MICAWISVKLYVPIMNFLQWIPWIYESLETVVFFLLGVTNIYIMNRKKSWRATISHNCLESPSSRLNLVIDSSFTHSKPASCSVKLIFPSRLRDRNPHVSLGVGLKDCQSEFFSHHPPKKRLLHFLTSCRSVKIL